VEGQRASRGTGFISFWGAEGRNYHTRGLDPEVERYSLTEGEHVEKKKKKVT